MKTWSGVPVRAPLFAKTNQGLKEGPRMGSRTCLGWKITESRKFDFQRLGSGQALRYPWRCLIRALERGGVRAITHSLLTSRPWAPFAASSPFRHGPKRQWNNLVLSSIAGLASPSPCLELIVLDASKCSYGKLVTESWFLFTAEFFWWGGHWGVFYKAFRAPWKRERSWAAPEAAPSRPLSTSYPD